MMRKKLFLMVLASILIGGFVGMRAFMEDTEEHVLALDGDLGKVSYGALGFGGGY